MTIRQPHKRALKQCIKRYGGKHEAAKAIGISKRYVDYLLKGLKPSRKVFLKIEKANRQSPPSRL